MSPSTVGILFHEDSIRDNRGKGAEAMPQPCFDLLRTAIRPND